MRSSLRKEEDLGSATMPEKSQPITFEGGREMEACLSGGIFVSLAGVGGHGVQTVGRVQRDVGYFYKDLGPGWGGNGDGVERWGAEKTRHEGFHLRRSCFFRVCCDVNNIEQWVVSGGDGVDEIKCIANYQLWGMKISFYIL